MAHAQDAGIDALPTQPMMAVLVRAKPWPLPSVDAKCRKGTTGATGCRGQVALRAVLLIFLFTLAGCTMINSFVFKPKKGISATPARDEIPFHEVWFKSDRGVKLNGWLIPGTPGIPLVVFFHGNSGNLSDNLDYIKLLHGEGFPLFIFDYRGYGKSSGTPRAEHDFYQDARAAVSFLERRGWAPEAMIYFGQSLGAAVALHMAMELPPAGLVMESSFTCMKEIVRHITPLGYYTFGWWGIDLPFDNLEKIAAVGVPVLLVHGDLDQLAPVEMARELFARAAEPKTLHIIAGGGHCDVFTMDSTAYLAAWNSYLRALPVRTAARDDLRP